MDGMTLYFAVLVPLAIIILLALFFYRLFTKNMKKDEAERLKMRKLEELKDRAEFREARIISVRPEGQSNTSPSNRYVNLRFEIKDNAGEFKMLSARWYVDTFHISDLQPDNIIQVKVYEDKVFPLTEDSRLVTD
ncbi:MAG: hypothetical protein JNK43_02055 [Ignavibacteria bacterium]|nr:hypothetical protein [Ignavibacteria bacterium]